MEKNSNDGTSHWSLSESRGAEITKHFPDILVTTKHTYEIEYKYIYACTNALCGLDFGRQKTLDLTRLVCGNCKSALAQIKPALKMTCKKEEKPNPFGLYVKENFAVAKKEHPGSPHKEIMGILAKEYHEQKSNQKVSSRIDETISIMGRERELGEIVAGVNMLTIE